MQERIRMFLNHSGRGDPARLSEVADGIIAIAFRAKPKAIVEVVPGYIDHDLNFQRLGSWDAWYRDIAFRVDEVTRRPVYDYVVIPALEGERTLVDLRLSQGQGLITWFMLQRGAPVRAFFPAAPSATSAPTEVDGWLRVAHAWKQDPSDFKHGWRVA